MSDQKLPSTRSEAKQVGAKHYATGSPCKRGHVAPRYTTTGQCTECLRVHSAENRDKYREKERRAHREWLKRNKDRVDQYSKRYLEENRCRRIEACREWREKNRDVVAEYNREYKARNKKLSARIGMKRRARKLNATPSWFGEFDEFVIKEAQHLAEQRERDTGIKWHIDHMVPLQSRNACGLHCADNLQVIPAYLNSSKRNKLWLFEPMEWLKHA